MLPFRRVFLKGFVCNAEQDVRRSRGLVTDESECFQNRVNCLTQTVWLAREQTTQ